MQLFIIGSSFEFRRGIDHILHRFSIFEAMSLKQVVTKALSVAYEWQFLS